MITIDQRKELDNRAVCLIDKLGRNNVVNPTAGEIASLLNVWRNGWIATPSFQTTIEKLEKLYVKLS